MRGLYFRALELPSSRVRSRAGGAAASRRIDRPATGAAVALVGPSPPVCSWDRIPSLEPLANPLASCLDPRRTPSKWGRVGDRRA